jgi:hypothetical protein
MALLHSRNEHGSASRRHTALLEDEPLSPVGVEWEQSSSKTIADGIKNSYGPPIYFIQTRRETTMYFSYSEFLSFSFPVLVAVADTLQSNRILGTLGI